MHDGALFHALRTDRHLTLQQVADEVNSIGTISKFERNQLALGYERFKHLLNRIDVSLEEFLFLAARQQGALPAGLPDDFRFNSQADPQLTLLLKKIQQLTTKRPTQAEIDAFDRDIARYRTPADGHLPTRRERFSALAIQMYQFFLQLNHDHRDDNVVDPQLLGANLDQLAVMVRPVVSYLYSVETWGSFELSTFEQFHTAIANETVHSLLPIALHRSAYYANFAPIADMRLQLLFGGFSDFINSGLLPWAKDALDRIATILTTHRSLTRANQLLFCRGWYDIVAGKVSAGKKTCEQAISIEVILGQSGRIPDYRQVLKGILQNVTEPGGAAYFM